MAKRYTISLPDELAQRIEPFKDQLSLSAIMQKSLEAELAELLRPEGQKTKAAALLERAKSYYKEDFSVLVQGASAYVDHLINCAVEDSDLYVFRLYNYLQRGGGSLFAIEEHDRHLSSFLESSEDDLSGSTSDSRGMLALAATYWFDRGTIDEEFPGARPWDDKDFTRILQIVLSEKLRSLLGDEAIQTYLTWGAGFRDIAAEHETKLEVDNEDTSLTSHEEEPGS